MSSLIVFGCAIGCGVFFLALGYFLRGLVDGD